MLLSCLGVQTNGRKNLAWLAVNEVDFLVKGEAAVSKIELIRYTSACGLSGLIEAEVQIWLRMVLAMC